MNSSGTMDEGISLKELSAELYGSNMTKQSLVDKWFGSV